MVAIRDNINHRKIIAIIPAYNEDRFIGSVVLKAHQYAETVIVVDDGSSDVTAAIAEAAGATVVKHEQNQGKGVALNTGFSRALDLHPSVVVMLDGDGQHKPEEIPELIRPILRGQADMVIGSRFRDTKSKIPLWRQVGQHVLTFITNIASGVTTSDSQSGFRAFSYNALKTLQIKSDGFSIESEMQFWARKNNIRIKEASISCLYNEKAKRNPFKHGVEVLNGILQLISRSRPLFFFGSSGLLLTMLGTSGWWKILQIYNQTSQFALGYALVATLLLILGVLTAFEGITLHTLSRMTQSLPPGTNAPSKTSGGLT
jgi:glycosyltransferase involved in cell wall biosynthesis